MAAPKPADVSFQYAGWSLFGSSQLQRRSKRLQGVVPEGVVVAEAEGQRVDHDDAGAAPHRRGWKYPVVTATARVQLSFLDEGICLTQTSKACTYCTSLFPTHRSNLYFGGSFELYFDAEKNL
jgi:hypothetical protein